MLHFGMLIPDGVLPCLVAQNCIEGWELRFQRAATAGTAPLLQRLERLRKLFGYPIFFFKTASNRVERLITFCQNGTRGIHFALL